MHNGPLLHLSDLLMPATILMMNMGSRSVAQEILRLETLITNIEYLLMLPGVSEEQKQRLRPLLMETHAELMSKYDIFELRHSA
jgi:hypothetical protein